MRNVISDILNNRTLVFPFVAWFVAQIIKVTLEYIKSKGVSFERFIGSGGMPSSHTSYITALAITVGQIEGFHSVMFGITSAFAVIVMYDAAGVRRAAGKQAEVLNNLIHTQRTKTTPIEMLKEKLGHSPVEVLAGALLGVIISIVLFNLKLL